jgi:glycerol-1-phosphate dehydrogenase [NAD(P)+]
MTKEFEKLESTLGECGVLGKHFVPQQLFCKERSLLPQFLSTLGQQAVVFVDGVSKKCEGATEIDSVFREALCASGISFDWINTSEVLNVLPPNLQASCSHIATLREITRAHSAKTFVVLGSGTLTDLVKYALHEEQIYSKLVSIPTAISVTAYTSQFSILDWHGAKRTKLSRCPDTVIWVHPFVANAPHAMSKAGYGDLLAPFLAYGDWALAHALGFAPSYSDLAMRLLKPFLESIKKCSRNVGENLLDLKTTEILCASLGMAGIGMSAAGETAPFSGCEHAISHGLDFLRTVSHRPHVLHGEQVALACLASAALFDWFLATPKPDVRKWRTDTLEEYLEILRSQFEAAPYWGESEFTFTPQERRKKQQEIEDTLKKAELEFHSDYSKKATLWRAQISMRKALAENWESLQHTIATLTMRSSDLEKLMREACLPLSPEDTNPRTTPMEYRWAVRFAPFVRNRLSIADLAFWMGEDPAILAGL